MFTDLARKRAGLGLEALGRVDLVEAGSLFGWAENALALMVERRKHVQLAPAAERGQPMIDGPKRPRRDALARLIDDALTALPPNATAVEVLAKCVDIDGGSVIQEIDRDDPDAVVIYWRARGGEKTTLFKTFQNRLTERRKKIT